MLRQGPLDNAALLVPADYEAFQVLKVEKGNEAREDHKGPKVPKAKALDRTPVLNRSNPKSNS